MIAMFVVGRWVIAALVLFAVYVGGYWLRQQHVIICRTHWRSTFAAMIFNDLWIAGTGYLLWNIQSAVFDIILFTAFHLIYPWEPGFRPLWRRVRQHRCHEEDCEFGPRRRFKGATARLRGWRKLSLNPIFAPS